MRLTNTVTQGPGSQYEGRVEVYYSGQWGTICSRGFDWEDAHVICVMAGFGTAVRPVTDGFYGPASQSIDVESGLQMLKRLSSLCLFLQK